MAKSAKIKTTFSLKKLAKKVPGLMVDLLNAKGKAIHDGIQNGIDLQKDIKDKSYKSMRQSTKDLRTKKQQGTKLLDISGTMRQTKQIKATINNPQYTIMNTGKSKRTGAYYGAFHNKGYTNSNKPKQWFKGAKIPKREWFGIPKNSKPGGKDYQKSSAVALAMIRDAWKKFG